MENVNLTGIMKQNVISVTSVRNKFQGPEFVCLKEVRYYIEKWFVTTILLISPTGKCFAGCSYQSDSSRL